MPWASKDMCSRMDSYAETVFHNIYYHHQDPTEACVNAKICERSRLLRKEKTNQVLECPPIAKFSKNVNFRELWKQFSGQYCTGDIRTEMWSLPTCDAGDRPNRVQGRTKIESRARQSMTNIHFCNLFRFPGLRQTGLDFFSDVCSRGDLAVPGAI